MNENDFLRVIYESNPEDWIYQDEFGVYVLKSNLSISIKRENTEDLQPFTEVWATSFPNPNAYIERYFLRYNDNIIEIFYTATVDGSRASIPYPRLPDMSLSREDYRLGRIVNLMRDEYEDYLRRLNINIIEI